MRGLIQATIIGLMLYAPPAFAQALPDNVRTAGVTVAQWQAVQAEVRRAALARGASERALAAVAERVSANLVVDGRIDLDQLLTSIDERAQQLAELQTQLAAMQGADDPAVAALLSQARAAIDAGDLTAGDQLLAQAAQSDLAGIARDQSRLTARQTRAAQTIAERARLAHASADYLAAAAFYAQAAETAPQSIIDVRWQYRLRQAGSLYRRGDLFNDQSSLREAILTYRNMALPLAPRETYSRNWASTQNDLGVALLLVGQRGDERALPEAFASLESALEVRTRTSAPADWAATQGNLGLVLLELGNRGDHEALRRAVDTYRSVLEIFSRESAPIDWAMAQNNLGLALNLLGQRGDYQALLDAVAAYRAALEVTSRTSAPSRWANLQSNLGNSLRLLGERGDGQALREAVGAYAAALQVYTREHAPIDWAGTMNNLGLTLFALGQRGDNQALRDAVGTYRLALNVFARSEGPMDWASLQSNMGNALAVLGERGDEGALRDALVAYRAALEVRTRTVAPMLWAETTNNLGLALTAQGMNDDDEALREAVSAFEATLEVRTRSRAPALWADSTYNLARAYRAQGRVREARLTAHDALVAYEQVHNTHWSAEVRAFLAQLPPS